jgi:cytochrome oxidase Cu insertion factor (SCO1/SenC/PrrC family)
MILASLLLSAAQAAAPERPDPMTLGPGVGQPLIAFEARDQGGAPRNLDSLKGPNGLALLFFRSADW